MARLGLSTRGFAEVVAVAEHIAGQSRAANALGLMSEQAEAVEPLLTLVPVDEGDPTIRPVFDEIQAWTGEALGWEGVPAFWRAIARRPRYLVAAWAKTKLVLGAGEVDRLTKTAVAYACASLAGSRYFVEYYHAALRQLGYGDDTVVELAGLVNHYASFNVVAHAFQLESPGAASFATPAEPSVPTDGALHDRR